MNKTSDNEIDQDLAKVIHHLGALTEWAKVDWLITTGRPMKQLGTTDAMRREIETELALMWIRARDNSGSLEFADEYFLRGLRRAALFLELGWINACGELTMH